MSYSQLPFFESLKYEIKILLKILRAHYIRKQKKIRTTNVVEADYENNAWKNILESEYWLKSNNLEQFCFTPTSCSKLEDITEIICLLDNKLVKTTFPFIFNYMATKNSSILKKFVTETDDLVELGCGFGMALFSFRSKGISNSMTGYDISSNAISAAKKINQHFRCNIKFDTVDLSKPFNGSFLKQKTVFTSHSFEQLKYYTETAIDSILRGKPKQVLHFEPVVELFGFGLRDTVSKVHNSFADYQDNLLTTLKKFEKQQKLKILEVKRLGHETNPFNETSFIRWEPIL